MTDSGLPVRGAYLVAQSSVPVRGRRVAHGTAEPLVLWRLDRDRLALARSSFRAAAAASGLRRRQALAKLARRREEGVRRRPVNRANGERARPAGCRSGRELAEPVAGVAEVVARPEGEP